MIITLRGEYSIVSLDRVFGSENGCLFIVVALRP